MSHDNPNWVVSVFKLQEWIIVVEMLSVVVTERLMFAVSAPAINVGLGSQAPNWRVFSFAEQRTCEKCFGEKLWWTLSAQNLAGTDN